MNFLLISFLSLVILLPKLNAQICSYGQFRLAGGATAHEGRLEMCFNNAWGTVCDNSWTDLDARVACRQLGYSTVGAIFLPDAYYGRGTGSVVLSNVVCTGNETTLLNCRHHPPGSSGGCGHGDDVGVYCPGSTCTNGTIRLLDGATYRQGRLQICINNVWGTICRDLWNNLATKVACRQLGFTTTVGVSFSTNSAAPPVGSILLDDVNCVGSEATILDCQHNPVGVNDCLNTDAISISCIGSIYTPPTNTCTTDSIRLAGTSTNYDGRLELCYNNAWGSVCDDGWTNANARVACRQLGYSTTGASFSSDVIYGTTPSGIFLDNTYCSGTESKLVNCRHTGIGYSGDCTHREDVTVVCQATCPYGSLRLISRSGSTSTNEGRLEICINNVWGTVCGLNWTISNTLVACRDLGYTTLLAGNVTYYTNAAHGQGTGPVFLNNVDCSESEYTLLTCSRSNIMGSTTCSHAHDVSVVCGSTIVMPVSAVIGMMLLLVLFILET